MSQPELSGLGPATESNGLRPLQSVQEPSLDLPRGYKYGVTRGADLFIRYVYPECFDQLTGALSAHRFSVADMVAAGGNRSNLAKGWDERLRSIGWGKRNVTVARLVDNEYVSSTRSHEIDMFKGQHKDRPYPGIAVEMEWSNKDPFFDRDLAAFEMLHTQGIIGAGVIVTRGPELQRLIKSVVPGKEKKNGDYNLKYGESTTHWRKLAERVERGGGGSCPLLLIGIEPDCFDEAQRIRDAYSEYTAASSKGKQAIRAFHAKILREGRL